MASPHSTATASPAARRRILLGAILLAVGLAGHLLAAQAIGGTYVAYRDHVLGFVLLSAVSGAILAGLGWRFWNRRFDITLLILGALQAVFGFVIYLERSNIH